MSLNQMIEHYLGSKAICTEELTVAKATAENKLQRIIEREGDADGERLKPYYLAQLIAEAIRANRFSLVCHIHHEDMQKKGKECAANANTPSNNSLILA